MSKEKRFVLRGAIILGDGHIHFTACIKAGKHWLFYNDMDDNKCWPGVFFQLFLINHGEKAMQGYGLAYVFYDEVLDLDEKVENDVDLSGLDDWTS